MSLKHEKKTRYNRYRGTFRLSPISSNMSPIRGSSQKLCPLMGLSAPPAGRCMSIRGFRPIDMAIIDIIRIYILYKLGVNQEML